MIRSIQIGSATYVQGVFIGTLSNGFIQVRVGKRIFTGRPVGARAA